MTCFVNNMPTGIGEPVFDKLDARLAQAVMSIGAVKAVEIGDGTKAARALGSENNDGFEAVAVPIAPMEVDDDDEDYEHQPSLEDVNRARALHDVDAAVAFFEKRGMGVKPETAKKNPDGSLMFIYLDKQIAGFAIHLKQY